ncbi:MAG: hypothetical protein ACRDP2_14570, partial [Nocardioidaceae bacterium]
LPVGDPWVAPDSPQAAVCLSAGESTLVLPLAGWLVASAVLLWVCARWTLRRTDAYWLGWAMVLPLVAPIVAFAGFHAPSDECSADKRLDPAY